MVLVTTNHLVASEPVPAVVVMQITGYGLFISERSDLLPPARKSRTDAPPCAAMKATALAVSMELPPPRPTVKSQPCSTKYLVCLSISISLGLGSTSSITATSTPDCFKSSTTRSRKPNWRMVSFAAQTMAFLPYPAAISFKTFT